MLHVFSSSSCPNGANTAKCFRDLYSLYVYMRSWLFLLLFSPMYSFFSPNVLLPCQITVIVGGSVLCARDSRSIIFYCHSLHIFNMSLDLRMTSAERCYLPFFVSKFTQRITSFVPDYGMPMPWTMYHQPRWWYTPPDFMPSAGRFLT